MKQYVIDAFTDKVFGGNPAAVCVMDRWISDELMQNIAIENNLSETAFTVKEGDAYRLRWFTPGGEIDLCGHATLATAYVIMNFVDDRAEEVRFQTMSGELIVNKKGDLYEMDFPAYEMKEVEVTDLMEEVIGVRPLEAWMGRDLVCVLEEASQVENANPNLEKSMELDGLLLHITAKGEGEYDCVSRAFAPKLSVDEDPVCGSGHCHIIPIWTEKTGKAKLTARQASKRGGVLYCRQEDTRIKMAGKAVVYSIGELQI